MAIEEEMSASHCLKLGLSELYFFFYFHITVYFNFEKLINLTVLFGKAFKLSKTLLITKSRDTATQ